MPRQPCLSSNRNSDDDDDKIGFTRKKQQTIECFVEIDNAYDNVDVIVIVSGLHKVRRDLHSVDICEFLKERLYKVKSINNSSIRCNGLAQEVRCTINISRR